MRIALVLKVCAIMAPTVYLACGSSTEPEVGGAADAGPEGSIVPGGDGGPTGNADGAPVGNPDTGTPGVDGSTGQDGGIVNDAGPGGSTTSLPCGTATCTIPGQTCCALDVGQGSFAFSCVAGSSCASIDAGNQDPPAALSCTSAANCGAGQVCCINSNNDSITATCQSQTDCDNAPGDTAVLCDPANPAVGCPQNEPCDSDNIDEWGLPNGFGTCGGQGN